ncbi:unnamed protein product [Cochlearia groenlandica]
MHVEEKVSQGNESNLLQKRKNLCRVEFFIESRTKPDCNFVNEEAKQRAEKLRQLMTQKSPIKQTKALGETLNDEYYSVLDVDQLHLNF